jgi:hypothetical protein
VPFETSSEVRKSFADLGKFCQQAGIRCFVINLPLHEMAYQLIPSYDEVAYRNTLRDLLTAAKLPLWDFDTAICRAHLDDNSFYDLNHLNSVGAARFTRLVAALYVEQVFGLALAPDNAAKCAQVIVPS